jgi:hypothetical protein
MAWEKCVPPKEQTAVSVLLAIFQVGRYFVVSSRSDLSLRLVDRSEEFGSLTREMEAVGGIVLVGVFQVVGGLVYLSWD